MGRKGEILVEILVVEKKTEVTHHEGKMLKIGFTDTGRFFKIGSNSNCDCIKQLLSRPHCSQ